MEFAVNRLTCSVYHLERMRAIPVHKTITIRGTAIRKQKAHLVGSLRS